MSKNYIIVSTLDWKSNWQIPHEVTKHLLSSDKNVLYIENTGIRSLMIKDIGRVLGRLRNFALSAQGFKKKEKNLTIFSPLLIPFPYLNFAYKINKSIYIKSIKKWLSKNDFKQTTLICFLPNPINIALIDEYKFENVIYYCLDNLAQGYNDAFKITSYEKTIIKKSDLNFYTSRKLLKKNFIKDKSFYLPSGVNLKNFNLKKKQNKSGNKFKVIGYIGAVSEVFDQKLLINIANKFRDYEFHIIGPVLTDVSSLEQIINIKFFGQVEHYKLKEYMKKFVLGIIPYKKNIYTESVYPCKLNEYLAMGIPVVSTDLSEIKNISFQNKKIFSVAKNNSSFIKKILYEIKSDNEKKRKIRKKFALSNSWENRFVFFENKINQIASKKVFENYESPQWNDQFIDEYNKNFNKIRKFFYSAVIIFILIFNSTLFWHLGNYLMYGQKPEIAEVMVVFSGDGKETYKNDSYQERALDAVKFYNDGYIDKIYLSSGREQKIPETLLIKSFLVNQGIPDEKIYVQKKYPNSTFKNILYVHSELKKQNISKVLFLTSPFHSLRASLIWKNFKDIEVITIKNKTENFDKRKFFMEFKEIKVITYEYLSIIYNYFKGNIN